MDRLIRPILIKNADNKICKIHDRVKHKRAISKTDIIGIAKAYDTAFNPNLGHKAKNDLTNCVTILLAL